MKKVIINGRFLVQRITGVQRYAREITAELDKLVNKGEYEIAVPIDDEDLPSYTNIRVVRVGKLQRQMWDVVSFPNYVNSQNGIGVNLCNVSFVGKSGIVVIHDITYKVNSSFHTSIHDKIAASWNKINFWHAAHSAVKIVTDSEFSKSEIIKYYHVDKSRIDVVYCGWQHMQRIDMLSDTFERYPMLEKEKYYFSMATLAANKNFKWILYAAKNSPNETFAIAGGGKLKGAAEAAGFADLPNVHFLGYVSDEDAKTLMASCKAFIFPTLYEGFGIPPLEAVACGAKHIIVSDTPCMHEIYGDNAEYIDPTDYENAGIPTELKEVGEALLNKYSWEKSAQKLKELIDECDSRR